MFNQFLKYCLFVLVSFVAAIILFYFNFNYSSLDPLLKIIIYIMIWILKSLFFNFCILFFYLWLFSMEVEIMLCWLPQETLKKLFLVSLNELNETVLNSKINELWTKLENYQREYLEFFFNQAYDESCYVIKKRSYLPGNNPFLKEFVYFLSDSELRRLILEIFLIIKCKNHLYFIIYNLYLENYNFYICMTAAWILFIAYLVVNIFLC